MPLDTIFKLIAFVKEVVSKDDADKPGIESRLLTYGFFTLLGVFLCFLVMSEQAYLQTGAKYKAIQHSDDVDKSLEQCQATNEYYYGLISSGGLLSDYKPEAHGEQK